MLKTLKNIRRRDTDKFMIPHSVQEVIPIRTVWKSGILLVGQNRYSRTWQFSDINYALAGEEDQKSMLLGYSALLDNSTAEAALRWPRQCNAIRACLAKLAEYEAAGSTDLDAVSGCFGALMAELFDYRQDHWSPELRSIGFHLGKFIYLLDAYDDLPRDKRRGAYNPLRELSTHPDYEEEMLDIFELLLARCAQNFERLPCVEDADLLRNILYSGVWLKYNCKNAKRTGKPDAS